MDKVYKILSNIVADKTQFQPKARFAKLTLSSGALARLNLQRKMFRSSLDPELSGRLASKKIFDELMTDDETSDTSDEGAASVQEQVRNKIFRSKTLRERKSDDSLPITNIEKNQPICSFREQSDIILLSSDDEINDENKKDERSVIPDVTRDSVRNTDESNIHIEMEKLEISESQNLTSSESEGCEIFNFENQETLSGRLRKMGLYQESITQNNETLEKRNEIIGRVSSTKEIVGPEIIESFSEEETESNLVIVISETESEISAVAAPEHFYNVSPLKRAERSNFLLNTLAEDRMNIFFDNYPVPDSSVRDIETDTDDSISCQSSLRQSFLAQKLSANSSTIEDSVLISESAEMDIDNIHSSLNLSEIAVRESADTDIEGIKRGENETSKDRTSNLNVENQLSDEISEENQSADGEEEIFEPQIDRGSKQSIIEPMNLAAKINIRLHVKSKIIEVNGGQSDSESERSDDPEGDDPLKDDANVNSRFAASREQNLDDGSANRLFKKTTSWEKPGFTPSKIPVPSNKKTNSRSTPVIVNELNIDEESKNILYELYGEAWEIVNDRNLKKEDLQGKPNDELPEDSLSLENEADFGETTFASSRGRRHQQLSGLLSGGSKSVGTKKSTSKKDRKFGQRKNDASDEYEASTESDDCHSDNAPSNRGTDHSSVGEAFNFVKKADNNSSLSSEKDEKNTTEDLVNLDLSNDVARLDKIVLIPMQGNDETLNQRVDELHKTFPASSKSKTTKRKLFNGIDYEANLLDAPEEHKYVREKSSDADLQHRQVKFISPMTVAVIPLPKKLEGVCKISGNAENFLTPKSKCDKRLAVTCTKPFPRKTFETAVKKFSFLQSLEVMIPKDFCHPNAWYYRTHFKTRKSELAYTLYQIYNEKIFENKLNTQIEWSKKLLNTAGTCENLLMTGNRHSKIQLSEKVVTSADRLRCTLIHELCHAAAWILNAKHGHGAEWQAWASKANETFPELPKISVSHQYDIEYKYTYKCTVCGSTTNAHSKSKKVENIRCSICDGTIEIFLNKKDQIGNVLATPVRKPTGFAKFVKENYKFQKKPYIQHANVMRVLSAQFAASKMNPITEAN